MVHPEGEVREQVASSSEKVQGPSLESIHEASGPGSPSSKLSKQPGPPLAATASPP